MPRKRYKPEEIVAKLRQVDVLVSQGQSMADAIRLIGFSEVTFYWWRREFGGLNQVKRLKDLELENNRPRKAVSDLTLDKLILTEAAKGNFSRLASPREQLLRRKPVPARYVRDNRARNQRLFDNARLVVRREPATSAGHRDHFQPANRGALRLKRMVKRRHKPISHSVEEISSLHPRKANKHPLPH